MQAAMARAIIREADRQGLSHERLSTMCGHRTDVFAQAWKDERMGIHRFLEAVEALNLDMLLVNPKGDNIL